MGPKVTYWRAENPRAKEKEDADQAPVFHPCLLGVLIVCGFGGGCSLCVLGVFIPFAFILFVLKGVYSLCVLGVFISPVTSRERRTTTDPRDDERISPREIV